MAWQHKTNPRKKTLFFRTAARSERSQKSHRFFHHRRRPETPRVFDMHSTTPNIIVHQGDVEDWIIENRSQELHAFHIHQIRFMLVQWNGVPVDEPYPPRHDQRALLGWFIPTISQRQVANGFPRSKRHRHPSFPLSSSRSRRRRHDGDRPRRSASRGARMNRTCTRHEREISKSHFRREIFHPAVISA